MISLSTIVAVEDFTAANGGTEVIPGSHMWSDEKIAGDYVSGDSESDPQFGEKLQGLSVCVEMPAGSCLVFAGTLLGYSIHPPSYGTGYRLPPTESAGAGLRTTGIPQVVTARAVRFHTHP